MDSASNLYAAFAISYSFLQSAASLSLLMFLSLAFASSTHFTSFLVAASDASLFFPSLVAELAIS
jgi:hypothetical protein